MDTTFAPRQPAVGAWAGYAAAAWALAFAVPSFYWGFGGHFLAETVSGQLAAKPWADHRGLQALVLATGVLKVVGAAFALSLVRPRWPRVNRRLMIRGGYAVSALLTAYGAVNVIGEALAETGVVKASTSTTVDWHALRWHLFLWDPYFVVWGVLLGLAVRHYQGAVVSRSGQE
ncbi:MAG: DUF3995 domain-containing protein [Actinocrinis sp.]